ncbi:hypothetical protein NTH58_004035 [Enterobacter oligotrophicus]|nr:hypothetical protein [Enterobacter oligotrophicus]
MGKCQSLSFEYPVHLSLSRKRIGALLGGFGFVEAADICRFLSLVCNEVPDTGDYLYLRFKIGQCLSRHDDKSEYFIPLRELVTELDCMIRTYLLSII